jgi:hypothetical protein
MSRVHNSHNNQFICPSINEFEIYLSQRFCYQVELLHKRRFGGVKRETFDESLSRDLQFDACIGIALCSISFSSSFCQPILICRFSRR